MTIRTNFLKCFAGRVVGNAGMPFNRKFLSSMWSATEFESRGLVSKETVVLRRWGSDTRKFGLSTELIM